MDNGKSLLPGLVPMSESDLKEAEGTSSETNERSSAAIARQKKRGLDNKPDHAELRHPRNLGIFSGGHGPPAWDRGPNVFQL